MVQFYQFSFNSCDLEYCLSPKMFLLSRLAKIFTRLILIHSNVNRRSQCGKISINIAKYDLVVHKSKVNIHDFFNSISTLLWNISLKCPISWLCFLTFGYSQSKWCSLNDYVVPGFQFQNVTKNTLTGTILDKTVKKKIKFNLPPPPTPTPISMLFLCQNKYLTKLVLSICIH